MNTRKGKSKFKIFRILLESGCSYVIVMGGVIEKLCPEKDYPMQWNTQAGNITTNLKVKIYFTLPALCATNVVMWNCHVNDYAEVRWDIILGQYLLTSLGINLKFS